MRNILFFSASILLLTACSPSLETKDYMQYVDPHIGTGAHYSPIHAEFSGSVRKQLPLPTSKKGNKGGMDMAHDPGQLYPAVLVPNGMNFWTAQTEDTEQKANSPYYYSDEEIQGFRNSHYIPGGATQDYGSFTLMPEGSELIIDPIERGSHFTHQNEIATPSYYSVELERYGIQAEMTATSRTALFRLTYKNAGDVYLVVNSNSDEGMGSMNFDSKTGTITGTNPAHRIYQGWGEYAGFDGHFSLCINKEILDGGTVITDSVFDKMQISTPKGNNASAWIKYHVEAGETVLVKAASSFTSIDEAQKNMQTESPDWDFDAMHQNLTDLWQKTLGCIEVESSNRDDLVNFYTSLYHASFLPHAFNDADGSYPAFSTGKPIEHTDGTYYEDYSMWDTYRALHPLICILDQQKAADMVQSLVDKYEQGEWLPIFPCWNSYTSEMIGDHCCSLVADAYFKGVRGFDVDKAYEALRKNAFEEPATYEEYEQGKGRRALRSYIKYGYIPVQDSVKEAFHVAEQTSRTLEYAYDDYVLSRLAEALGHSEDAQILKARSANWKNVFNPALGWSDGRNEDGTWVNGDPFAFQPYITEGQPCHYTWYVPHDVEGLIDAMGGKENFIAKLDTLFDTGHYWHGNEPSHQICYLYDYAGAPEKTRQRVTETLNTQYAPEADGLAGNDDAGQMSAWYIFSTMGFYPVCPGVPEYALGVPRFTKVTIHMSNGKDFTIKAPNAGKEDTNCNVTLNGKKLDRPFFQHEDIVNGGTLIFE